jgi:hypothetical protein
MARRNGRVDGVYARDLSGMIIRQPDHVAARKQGAEGRVFDTDIGFRWNV